MSKKLTKDLLEQINQHLPELVGSQLRERLEEIELLEDRLKEYEAKIDSLHEDKSDLEKVLNAYRLDSVKYEDLENREKYIEEKEKELFVKETKLDLEIERGRSATLANSNSVIMEALSTLCKAPIVRKEIQRQVARRDGQYNPTDFDTAVDEVEITEE